MKHLKTFESYSPKANEAFRHVAKKLIDDALTLVASPLILTITNLMDPRLVLDAIKNNLDVYHSLPTLIQTLESLLNEHANEITDTEREDIEYKLKRMNKMLVKYPTLDSYKRAGKKLGKIGNFRNRNFISNQIDTYQPKILNLGKAVEQIKKINKNLLGDDSVFNLADNMAGAHTKRGTVARIFRQARNAEEANANQPNNRHANEWTNEFDR